MVKFLALELGAKVYGISNNVPTSPSMFEILNLSNKINHFNEDIRNYDKVEKIIRDVKPDFYFIWLLNHSLLLHIWSHLKQLHRMSGTTNVLEALRLVNHMFCLMVLVINVMIMRMDLGLQESDSLGGKDIYSGSKGAAELILNLVIIPILKIKQI